MEAVRTAGARRKCHEGPLSRATRAPQYSTLSIHTYCHFDRMRTRQKLQLSIQAKQVSRSPRRLSTDHGPACAALCCMWCAVRASVRGVPEGVLLRR